MQWRVSQPKRTRQSSEIRTCLLGILIRFRVVEQLYWVIDTNMKVFTLCHTHTYIYMHILYRHIYAYIYAYIYIYIYIHIYPPELSTSFGVNLLIIIGGWA